MKRINLLLIDNYDSFTYNLYDLFSSFEEVSLSVKRNDEDLSELDQGKYDAVIIGSGPGSPINQAYFGKCLHVIQEYGTKGLPIFGVCLGFQGIAYAFGASLKRCKMPKHGKLSPLTITKHDTLFKGVTESPKVMCYHSLMIDPDAPLPDDLIFTAMTEESEESTRINGREWMALEHVKYPIYGVQFHPESYATEAGRLIVENFFVSSGLMTNKIQAGVY